MLNYRWIPAAGLLLAVACYDKGEGVHLLASLKGAAPSQGTGSQSRPASGPASDPASGPASRPASRPAKSDATDKGASKPVAKRDSTGAESGKPGTSGAIPSTSSLVPVLAKVTHGARVDYAEVGKHRAVLDDYLAGVDKVDLRKANDKQKLAFYINAYNVSVLTQVLDRVLGKGPKGADLPGVLAVPGKPGFFDSKSVRVSGEHLSLNELESKGRALGDPRIHFAVNCASVSCPALLNRPWVVATLDKDLEEATRRHFATTEGLETQEGKVQTTQLLNWYAKDFGGKEGARRFLEKYAPAGARAAIQRGIDGFLTYNWALNRK